MGNGYGSHWGMMNWGNGGYWPLGMIIWLVIVFAIIALVGWGVSAVFTRGRDVHAVGVSALDLLEQRYARGEIGRDEYLQKKNDMSGR